MGSEPSVGVMAVMQKNGCIVLTVATLGNFLGALTSYAAGRWSRRICIQRFLGIKTHMLINAEKRMARWGEPVLFFAWLPIIGDPLTVLAGVLRVHPLRFTLWVLPGKALRYYVILRGVDMWQSHSGNGIF